MILLARHAPGILRTTRENRGGSGLPLNGTAQRFGGSPTRISFLLRPHRAVLAAYRGSVHRRSTTRAYFFTGRARFNTHRRTASQRCRPIQF